MNFPHPLWGATLDKVSIDLLRQTVVLNLHVNDSTASPATSRHALELRDVTDFHWFNSIPGPWDYAEVTEIRIYSTDSGESRVEIMLWSEDAGLSITAGTVFLDGEENRNFSTDARA
jgi:hypothetical protein